MYLRSLSLLNKSNLFGHALHVELDSVIFGHLNTVDLYGAHTAFSDVLVLNVPTRNDSGNRILNTMEEKEE